MSVAEERQESQTASAPPPSSSPPEKALTFPEWLTAVVIGILLLALTAFIIRRSELITGRYLTTGVPPVPAFAALFLLVALRPLTRRLHPVLAFRQPQVLLVYAMMTVGVFLGASYSLRAFLPHIVGMLYWPGKFPELLRYRDFIPSWYAPADQQAITDYFLGGAHGVPWDVWAMPLLRWAFFFLALFLVGGCLISLFRKQWVENERLSFPLLYLPLTLSAESGSSSAAAMLRGPFLWTGIGIAAVFNGFNIGHAFNPAIPKPGFYYGFSGQFPDAIYAPLNSITLFFMLEVIGFGYFIPLEISFSAWFFYLAEKAVAVAGLAAGNDAPGFPYLQDQSAGAYLGVAALVLYGARHHLSGVFRRAFGFAPPTGRTNRDEAREERAAVFGLLGSLLFLLGWWWVAGFSMVVALPFLALLLCFTLVYARLRAESGVPAEFTYPYGLPHQMLANWFTVRGLLDTGGPRSWALLSNASWLSRHHTLFATTAYQVDGLKMAAEARMRRGWMWGALLIAFLAGLVFMTWAHLDTYYAIGSNLSAGTDGGEYRAKVALQEYQRMASQAATPPDRDLGRMGANLFGAGFAIFLGAVRSYFVRSPFHPLGYILATAYGDSATGFFPLLIAWASKALILKAGGLPLYRRFLPLFLGLIVGHYLIAGVIWPLMSVLLAPEASRSYHLYFGG